MSEHVIELNGKRYDAVTGALLGASHTSVAVSLAPAKAVHHMPKRGVIDGFMKPAAKPGHHAAPHATKVSAVKSDDSHVAVTVVTKPPASKPMPKSAEHSESKPTTHTAPAKAAAAVEHPKEQSKPTRAHTPAKAAAAHQPQHAKTLMRRAVHKPITAMKPKIKAQLPSEMAVKTPSSLILKHSASQIDPRRQAHAGTVGKHHAVQHFRPHRAEIGAVSSPIMEPVAQSVPIIAVQPAPPLEHRAPAHHTDIFEAAMAKATSHKEPAPKKHHSRRRRMANVMAGIGAFVVIGSFFAWLNMPNIQLQVASVRAGFKAEIPDYRPTGYAMEGGVQRYGNTVSMSFRSGSSKFQLTQQPSDWNSQTLLENTLALNGDHKTVEVGGRTVYIYGEGNAAWVDRGVRYDLTGNASLNADDITQLVSSL